MSCYVCLICCSLPLSFVQDMFFVVVFCVEGFFSGSLLLPESVQVGLKENTYRLLL